MRIYISGPISDIENYMENFNEAETDLKNRFPQATIMNPARINKEMPEDFTHDDYMQFSLMELSRCDHIYLLDGWRKSTGANMEVGFAYAKNISFIE